MFSYRIVTQGFHKKIGTSSPSNKNTPRIPVSSNLLLEMVEGAYFAMFNEFYTLALQAVKDIDQRAQYELFPDVMLVTSAVINSLKNNPTGKFIHNFDDYNFTVNASDMRKFDCHEFVFSRPTL